MEKMKRRRKNEENERHDATCAYKALLEDIKIFGKVETCRKYERIENKIFSLFVYYF